MDSKISVYRTTSAVESPATLERRTLVKNIVHVMLLHEHNLVPKKINETTYLRCTSCGTIYCQLCGNSLDESATQNHHIEKFECKHCRKRFI
jgi:hypothetical protein